MVGRFVMVFGLLAAACTNVQTASDSGAGVDIGVDVPKTSSDRGAPPDQVMPPDVSVVDTGVDVFDATMAVGMDVPIADVVDAGVVGDDGPADREDALAITDVSGADAAVDAGPPRMTFTFVSAALVGGGDGGPQMRATITWHGMLRGENADGVRLEAFFR